MGLTLQLTNKLSFTIITINMAITAQVFRNKAEEGGMSNHLSGLVSKFLNRLLSNDLFIYKKGG